MVRRMEPLRCESCGGQLKESGACSAGPIFTCEYCGNEWVLGDDDMGHDSHRHGDTYNFTYNYSNCTINNNYYSDSGATRTTERPHRPDADAQTSAYDPTSRYATGQSATSARTSSWSSTSDRSDNRSTAQTQSRRTTSADSVSDYHFSVDPSILISPDAGSLAYASRNNVMLELAAVFLFVFCGATVGMLFHTDVRHAYSCATLMLVSGVACVVCIRKGLEAE